MIIVIMPQVPSTLLLRQTSHWPGTHQLGQASQPVTARELSSSTKVKACTSMSSFLLWLLGIALTSTCSHCRPFTHGTISPAPDEESPMFFSRITRFLSLPTLSLTGAHTNTVLKRAPQKALSPISPLCCWCSWWGQRTTCRTQFSLSTMWGPGIKIGSLCWQQVPLLTEPCHPPKC